MESGSACSSASVSVIIPVPGHTDMNPPNLVFGIAFVNLSLFSLENGARPDALNCGGGAGIGTTAGARKNVAISEVAKEIGEEDEGEEEEEEGEDEEEEEDERGR
jgi:hypothetical protein